MIEDKELQKSVIANKDYLFDLTWRCMNHHKIEDVALDDNVMRFIAHLVVEVFKFGFIIGNESSSHKDDEEK